VALAVGGTLAGLAIALSVPPLRHAVVHAVHGDTAAVRSDLSDIGAGGVILVLALAVIHTVVWFPAEILNAAAGFIYGFWPALPLVMAGWVLSAIVAYWLGRHLGRPLIYRLAGEARFRSVEELIHRGGVTFLLAARLVPIVPFSLTGLAAGAARVPMGRFVWTTAVGYLPITAYFTYVGSQLESFSLEDPIVWIGAGGLLLALVGVRHLVPRSTAERGASGAETDPPRS
jgi:uncharacterized membrane protein YdjX (TVP38/TMEM64 family)